MWEKNKRDEWTTARNAAHVKKGAVSGVNLGESIAKILDHGACHRAAQLPFTVVSRNFPLTHAAIASLLGK